MSEIHTLKKDPDKIWNVAFTSVFIANCMLYMGEQMVQTLVTSYAKSLGAGEVIIGIVGSAFALTAILFKVLSAPAIDTYNKKYILAAAMLVIFISCLGYSFASSVKVVFAFRLLQGAGKAFTATCCLAMATDALPPSKLGQGIGIFSLAQAICQAIAPTIGKFVQSSFGFRATFLLSAACLLCGAVCALNIRNDFVQTKKFRISLDSMFAKDALIPAAALFTLSLCFSLINSFMFIYSAEKLDPGQYAYIGFYFTIYAGTLLFTRPMVGRLSDKYGTVKVVIPAMLAFALSFYLLSAASSIWMFFLAAFVSAFGYGACQPALNALSMRMVPKDRRGAASCTNYIGTDLGQLIGPTLGGFIVSLVGYSRMWSVMTLSMYCGVVIMLVFRRRITSFDMSYRNKTANG